MGSSFNIIYESSLTKMCEVNPSFDKGVLKIAYAGENRNGSYISKQAFERNIKTMFNCPIVCNYDRNSDTLGGHDIDVIKDGHGSVKIINVTTPVGVVPESANYWWDTVVEDDGTEREYLFVEVLIWKRQECYDKLKRDGVVSQSMEITVVDGYLKDGIYYIDNFVFTAFALIGVEPCFESASLEMFALSDFKQQMSEMMRDLKQSLYRVNTSEEEDDNIETRNYSMEGGEEVLEEKIELAAEYGIDTDSLDFSMEDYSLEEIKEKFEAMKEGARAELTEETTEQFELTSNLVEEIRRQIDEVYVQREWGECHRYWYVDCDFEINKVYCWDVEDWLLYGFDFERNGDSIIIRFETQKRMKYVIEEFDEGEQSSPFAQVFATLEQKLHDNAELEAKYQSASDTIESMKVELTDLRKFKSDADAATAKAERDEILAQFEDLSGVEAFDLLCESCMEYDVDTLEEKCYAIRGRNNHTAKFSHEEKATKIKIDVNTSADEPYGGLLIGCDPVK